MISKFYEIAKYKDKIGYYLFYGENDGQKLDIIETNFNYTSQILQDINIFLSAIS